MLRKAFVFRNAVMCLSCVLLTAQSPRATAQSKDPLVEKLTAERLTMEIDDLKLTVADQDKRIAELEKTVKMLQAAANPVPAPIPAPTPAWKAASSWVQVKPGMSEARVESLLGPPTSVSSVEDSRTLYYQPSTSSASTLNGSVTLKDDRVIAMTPPAFE